jgi:hypothetical protein
VQGGPTDSRDKRLARGDADRRVVELSPGRGRAVLVAVSDGLSIQVPEALRAPWSLPLESLASVEWYSRSRAAFRCVLAEMETVNDRRFMVRYSGVDPDARLTFRRPIPVPLSSHRWWSRPIVVPAELRFQGRFDRISACIRRRRLLRSGLATSLEIRAADRDDLFEVLVHSGLRFPQFGEPS